MSTFSIILFLICMAGMLTGCASPYIVDRGRDAADIFTATLGVGAGGKARVGPIQTGLIGNADVAGLRCGQWFYSNSKEQHEYHLYSVPGEANVLVIGVDYSSSGKMALARHKAYMADQLLIYSHPTPWMHKGARVDYFPYSYYTQIEATIALGPSIRLGFNPGELLDFLLGWTTIDIFNDDLEIKNPSFSPSKTKAEE